jgi:phage gpG-like protein
LAEFVSGRLVAQYALVRSVVIPARPFLGYSPQFISELGDLWSEVLARKIQNGFEGK